MALKKSLNLDVDHFLKNYWQKQPLLIRQAYTNFQNPISADELAGLACEPDAESRIILQEAGRNQWKLKHGPFKEKDFKKLPASRWTLLVQGTDHWVAELQEILEDFYFLPQWRLDDIMTSFAVKEGSVGPHIDNYDVFLLQAEGQREWRISDKPLPTDEFIEGLEVKILKKFTPAQTFVLNSGDMLYLPPRFAHYGIAVDRCITHSIGFRAPSLQEMVDDYFTHQLSYVDPQAWYRDPDLQKVKNPGEIDKKTLQKITQIIRDNLGSEETIKRWFGQFVTANNKACDCEFHSDELMKASELKQRLKNGEQLVKSPASRFSYIKGDQQIYFYADGVEFILGEGLEFAAVLFCTTNELWQQELAKAVKNTRFVKLLLELIRLGHYHFIDSNE